MMGRPVIAVWKPEIVPVRFRQKVGCSTVFSRFIWTRGLRRTKRGPRVGRVMRDYTAGFVTHAKDLDPTLAPYESLFSRFATEQIRLEGLSTVAGHYDYTVADPVSTGAHGCPEDEAL